MEAAPPDAGFPWRVRVGVIGHRRLADAEPLRLRLRDVLDDLARRLRPSERTGVVFAAVSALAEGADRLMAAEILDRPGSSLEAVLPLAPDDYAADFAANESRDRFASLLARADGVEVVSARARPEAYLDAGRAVVDRCDVLVAVWDGEPARGPGGTGDAMAHADALGRPTVVIPPDGAEPRWHRPLGAPPEWVRALDAANHERMGPGRVRQAAERAGRDLLRGVGPDLAPAAEALVSWILPAYTRADVLAVRSQRRHENVVATALGAAAAAVAVAAAQAIFFPHHPGVAWIEAGLILGVLGLVYWGRGRQVTDLWLCQRALAERLRSLFPLALAGVDLPHDRRHRRGGHAWVAAAVEEAWLRRPRPLPPADFDAVRLFLAEQWVGGQIRYHEHYEERYERWHGRIKALIIAVAVATLAMAVVHATGWGEETALPRYLSWLGVVLPAAVGAVAAVGEQREYLRHAERYGQMAERLTEVKGELAGATGSDELRRAAMVADAVMRDEAHDWFSLMRIREIELPA